MCTSVFINSKEDNRKILARTFDFPVMFSTQIFVVPRNYKWTSFMNGTVHEIKYAFAGMGADVTKALNLPEKVTPVFYDGINEKGLMGAELYLPGYTKYNQPCHDKMNIEGYEFLLWALTNCESLDDLKTKIEAINIVGSKVPLLNAVPPLHWIFADKSGKSVVIEKTCDEITFHENIKTGVMTNSPNISWHETNYEMYMSSLSNKINPSKQYIESVEDLSKNICLGGGISLPGDFQPTSRFVRAAYLRNHIEGCNGEMGALTAAFKILDNTAVPKGITNLPDIVASHTQNVYTLYKSAMCAESCTYYFTVYDNNQINAVRLLSYSNLDGSEIEELKFPKEQVINYL